MTLTPPYPIMPHHQNSKSLNSRLCKPGAGGEEHLWAVSELLVCWPFPPTPSISIHSSSQGLGVHSEQLRNGHPHTPKHP